MTEDMEAALLGHVIDMRGDLEHVRSVVEKTLEQALRTNGRVSALEDWRQAHDHRVEVIEARQTGAETAHAEHAARVRRRWAAVTGTMRFGFDNWQALAIACAVLAGITAGVTGVFPWQR